MQYAELHCLSNFSFQRGASHPDELAARAAELGYTALAITDECSFAGVARAHRAAKEHGLHLIIGTEITLTNGIKWVMLARNKRGYEQLCALITHARRRAEKGDYEITPQTFKASELTDCWLILIPPYAQDPSPELRDMLAWLAIEHPRQAWVGLALHPQPADSRHRQLLASLRRQYGLPVVATGDVHMHRRGRRALQDVLCALRLGTTIAGAGRALFANGERHLRPRPVLESLYPADTLEATCRLAAGCRFSLDELVYRYPAELVPAEQTAAGYLRRLVMAGCQARWPGGTSARVTDQIERELSVIEQMGYAHYFLTVHDIVRFARSADILCQGRGSAANSVVCFCLGITEVDPTRRQMLFERFISRERDEPPDIDVDFEHERREEVIQYIYAKYGRERAALAATVICYRPRSAVRDVGKVLGLSQDQVDTIAKSMTYWDRADDFAAHLQTLGLDVSMGVMRQVAGLVGMLVGFPRHLSQHVGGFVLSDSPLDQLVPVENAAMADRTIIQWDKDDLEALGLMKVDVLALGMLSCIRRCFDLVAGYSGRRWAMATIPAGDGPTYAMIQRADTLGVFQIESRAQMSMLPRLRPEKFFDLVIEVAIVRPGPIQGGMVHPYLRRKQGLDEVTYPSPALQTVLERTLGVPIFQEQVMQIAMVAGGFSPGEADALRRAMAAWKKKGGLEPFRERLKNGMLERGYEPAFADQLFEQIKGFGSYGFPESHAVSFALLAYVSAYLKCHEPAAFAAALLNSQPMGFYAPAQIVADARRHGVTVRAVDIRYSAWDCALECDEASAPALRLGLRLAKGLSAAAARRIVQARSEAVFTGIDDLVTRAVLDARARAALARADALRGLAGHRHAAEWQIAGAAPHADLLAELPAGERPIDLPEPAEGQDIVADYASTGLTLRRHPMALLRGRLRRRGVISAADFSRLANGHTAQVAGLVTIRQRPGTAKGTVFVTLEDETGSVNVIVRAELFAACRQTITTARLLRVHGVMQRAGSVIHCIARSLADDNVLLGDLPVGSRNFH